MLTGSSALNAAVIEQEDKDLARAESIGVPIALLVLLVAFGTLVAAGLPILLGVAALMTSFGVLGALSYLTSFDTFVQAVVTMLGLALGIDYCLFIVTRQCEELQAQPNRPIAQTVGATMASAGKAVLFSGFTVLISVAGLLLVRAPVFRSMAFGVMVAVAVMLTVAMTLLPAVLALCFPGPYGGRRGGDRTARPVARAEPGVTGGHRASMRPRRTGCRAARRPAGPPRCPGGSR
ncbi:MMPL family transporter [Streptomyces sp. NPDC006365]|uniref:MMPL family transporter n=1 Tax=Streptomyces sp. NPDC006365 TaxID=3364744 RepID=UPI0036D03FFA